MTVTNLIHEDWRGEIIVEYSMFVELECATLDLAFAVEDIPTYVNSKRVMFYFNFLAIHIFK